MNTWIGGPEDLSSRHRDVSFQTLLDEAESNGRTQPANSAQRPRQERTLLLVVGGKKSLRGCQVKIQ